MTKKIDKLLDTMILSSELAMTPHNKNASIEMLELFDFFSSINKDVLYKALMNKDVSNNDNIHNAFLTIKHYKGLFSFFDTTIDFNTFQKIKHWLDDDSLKVFELKFFREYAYLLLSNKIHSLDESIIQLIIDYDIELYIKIARKLKIKNAINIIFNKNSIKVFDWLNSSTHMYNDLVQLNQDKFILENMNGNLDITIDSIKYIIEKAEPSFDLFVALKRKIGIGKLWELSSYKLDPIFYVDIVETLDEFLFVLNIKSLSLTSLETILDKMKIKFPNIYENFNSLLFVKKEFHNK